MRIELHNETKKDELVERDPVQLAIFSHRYRTLRLLRQATFGCNLADAC